MLGSKCSQCGSYPQKVTNAVQELWRELRTWKPGPQISHRESITFTGLAFLYYLYLSYRIFLHLGMLAVYNHWRGRGTLAATYTQMIQKNENIIHIYVHIYTHTYGRRIWKKEMCSKCKYLCYNFMSICIWNIPFLMIEKQVSMTQSPSLGDSDGWGWSTDQSLSVFHLEGSWVVIAVSVETNRTLHLNPYHAPSLPFLPLPPPPSCCDSSFPWLCLNLLSTAESLSG